MILDLDISLDLTLGCGQAHRWQAREDGWEGVLDGQVLFLRQRPGGAEVRGHITRERILEYLRAQDDLDAIYRSVAVDPLLQELTRRYPGLRLLRQDPWECLATYVLAVNANVKRIGSMVENLCRTFGERRDGRYTFPAPGRIADNHHLLDDCRLGYRCQRLRELALAVDEGRVVPESFREMPYPECVTALKKINGVGDKVADCVALFAMDRLEAFPVDARIRRCLLEHYGVPGPYRRWAEFGRERFGPYAGYAQELIYQSMSGSSALGQTQEGGV